jgi:sigma-B regulation protein RsbU (phosphoserine phosphatase)
MSLETGKPDAARITALEQKIAMLEKAYADLEKKCEEQAEHLSHECEFRDQQAEELRLAEVIIDKSPVILFRRIAGEEPRLVYVSRNISQWGYDADDFLNYRIYFKDIVIEEDNDRLGDEIKSYVEADAEEYTQYYRIRTADGNVRWVEDKTSVVRNEEGEKLFHQGILVDITERRLAEEELRRSEEKHRRIIETAGEGFLLMDDHLEIIYVNDAYCKMIGYPRDEIIGKTPLDLATEKFANFMMSNRDRILAMDYRKFEGTLLAKDGRVVPVLIHGNTLRDDRGARIGNVAFVTDLTEQKKALDLAGKVQKSLIPSKAPRIEGLDIAGRSDSCDEVGGDYFDFLFGPEYSDKNVKVVVGDIAGHGVDAALLMTTARAFIRSRAAQPGSPAQIVSSMNNDLVNDMKDSGHFMTLFFLEIDPQNGNAQWVRAGHEPALLYTPSEDRFDELVGDGIALGVEEKFPYAEYALARVPPGTVVALGTDGIWETTNRRGEPFGKERFRNIIKSHSARSAQEILNKVFDEVNRFTEGTPPQDDITLVVIKVDS